MFEPRWHAARRRRPAAEDLGARGRRLLGLVVALSTGCTANPEPRGCTLIGCQSGLTIGLEKASPWGAGAYRFDVDLDGMVVTCEGSLPRRGCDGGPSAACEPPEPVDAPRTGCVVVPGTHDFASVAVAGAPRTAVLKISRDGQTLHMAWLTPTYTRSQPNGEGCSPICDNAYESVKVP